VLQRDAGLSATAELLVNPCVSCKIISLNFPSFTAGSSAFKFVNQFKYLGNIITEYA